MLEGFSLAELKAMWYDMTRGHAFASSVLVVIVLLSIRRALIRVVHRNVHDTFLRQRYQRTISYITLFTALVVLLPVWLPSIRSIATFLGIFGAGFIIVTRDLWVCVVGWAYIMIRRPFGIGDRIQIGNVIGDVIDIRLMETSVIEFSQAEGGQATGRLVYFPNSRIFTESFATIGAQVAHIFQELQVHLTPDSDWQKAAKLLEQIARESYSAIKAPQPPANAETLSNYREPRVLVQMVGGHIVLRLHYMAPNGLSTESKDYIWRSFITAARKYRSIRFPQKTD